MFSFPKAFYYAVFHSVSAFCNAGFSLFPDNLMQFYNSPLTVFTVSFLVISGGLGFHVIQNAFSYIKDRMKRKYMYKRKTLSETSKIILTGTIFLLLAGTYLFYALEHGNTLKKLSTPTQYLTAFFQSVTLRSAGFNTVNFSELTHATQIMMLIFMFIGAGPGSTGGGIKITSFVILCAAVYSYITERKQTVLFRKAVRSEIVTKVFVSFFYSIGMLFIGLFLLVLSVPEIPVSDLLFETVSAFATVGASTGITQGLNISGKLILISLMFAGKVGTLTLFSAVTSKSNNTKIEYPSANINIG
jgi:trk system potassium uptake protein TrkH